ncbi:MAG: ABC transporter ATP-binding protein [Chloroflexi bacterium]|nr:ABC transporter ATP-binding protein [Chloroflexota bacterium]
MHVHHGGHPGPGMGRLGASIDEDVLGRVYDHRVVMRLLGYMWPHRRLLLVSLVGMLLYTGASVALPWVIKWGIDDFIATKDLAGLNRAALVFGGVMLANYVFMYIHQMALAKASQQVLYELRTGMFNHLQRLSISFFDRNEVGRVMSRVQNDVQQLQEFLSIMILGLGDLLSLVGIIVAMLLMNPSLALITLTVIPILFAVVALWQRNARRSFMRVRHAIAVVNAGLQENISGVRVVQSLNRQEVNLQRFERANAEHLNANLDAGRLSSTLLPTVELLTALALGFVVVFGGYMVLDGALAVGALVAFAMYIQRFFDPIRNLTMQYTELQRAMASGARVFELMDVQPEVRDRPGARPLSPISGDVRYEGVGFQYVPGVPVLRDIDLHVQPGQTVALVGPTGAGKTTMVNLLARFYDVTSGQITIDGHDIRDVTRDSLARQMSVVLQEPFLFSGTVIENIRYCHTEATEEAVVRAARAVRAHDFIERLERGYQTPLLERGRNLSVGQRQLISFARAILADPRILILDEATANIDTHTELLIQEALRELLRGRTAVVIAHRLSTIRNADLIVVLDEGRIVEAGTHAQLLARGGLYSHLSSALAAAAPGTG